MRPLLDKIQLKKRLIRNYILLNNQQLLKMKEYIVNVEKLRLALWQYQSNPTDKNYFKLLDLDAIIEFMSAHLAEQIEDQEKTIVQEIFLN